MLSGSIVAISMGSVFTTRYCGGIAGQSGGVISHCSNAASITFSRVFSGPEGYGYGGIAGSLSNATVSDCYSTGSIGGLSNLGGIAGTARNATISNSFSTSPISVTRGGGSNVGALVGNVESGVSAVNCYYQLSDSIGSTLGTGMTAEQFASGEVTYLLNGSSSEPAAARSAAVSLSNAEPAALRAASETLIWGQDLDVDAHPVFHDKDNTVYCGYEGCWSQEVTYSNSELYETRPAHSFGGEWFSDDTGHWQECQNGECDATSEVIAHTASPDLVGEKDPTATEEGYTGDVVCSECDHVMDAGEVIDELPPASSGVDASNGGTPGSSGTPSGGDASDAQDSAPAAGDRMPAAGDAAAAPALGVAAAARDGFPRRHWRGSAAAPMQLDYTRRRFD